MSATRSISWKRIVAEGAAIVVSILLAFAIDAWWTDKRERDEVLETLAIVHSDFRRSLENLESRQVRSAAKLKSINQLLEASLASTSDLTEEGVDSLLGDVTWYAVEHTVSTGALDSLVDTGGLRLVEDIELRRNLADWPRYLGYVRETIDKDFLVYQNAWLPLMREIGYLPQIAMTMTHPPGLPETTFPIPVAAPRKTIQHSALLSDRRFHNMLIELWWVQTDIQSALDDLEHWLISDMRLMERELGL
jgi:hypothetical protein